VPCNYLYEQFAARTGRAAAARSLLGEAHGRAGEPAQGTASPCAPSPPAPRPWKACPSNRGISG